MFEISDETVRRAERECEPITRDLKKACKRMSYSVIAYLSVTAGLVGSAFLAKHFSKEEVIPYFLNSAFALTAASVPLIGGYMIYQQGKALLRLGGLVRRKNEKQILEQSKLEQDLQDSQIW